MKVARNKELSSIMITDRQAEACRIWGLANKSDPFAERVARTEYGNGIAGRDRVDYEADQSTENRDIELFDGNIHSVPFTVYRNMKRP